MKESFLIMDNLTLCAFLFFLFLITVSGLIATVLCMKNDKKIEKLIEEKEKYRLESESKSQELKQEKAYTSFLKLRIDELRAPQQGENIKNNG